VAFLEDANQRLSNDLREALNQLTSNEQNHEKQPLEIDPFEQDNENDHFDQQPNHKIEQNNLIDLMSFEPNQRNNLPKNESDELLAVIEELEDKLSKAKEKMQD
jgi:hypothetical protein